MKFLLHSLFVLCIFILPTEKACALSAGIGKAEITPPIGTPSAGYKDRKGKGMTGVHDPLLAIALFISNGDKNLVLCSVDHLGFTYDMVQRIREKIQKEPALKELDIFIGSSHTHSGGGAYLNIPVVGPYLAGAYSKETTQFYIDKTCEAIFQAWQNRVPAKIGIGYGEASTLSQYRALWPKEISPLHSVTLIKVTDTNHRPLAALFNYPVHPTVLTSQNSLFSADFVGYARDYLKASVGGDIQPLYFNGAQGDINPLIFDEEDRFHAADLLGKSLAETVKTIWDQTEVAESLHIATQKEPYSIKPQATPAGITLPVDAYPSEMNIVVFNHLHAFLTIPGELSCIYDRLLKETAERLGFTHLSILGLTNDAHGYIILPDAWRHKTVESNLSFGGEEYGEVTKKRAEDLLKANRVVYTNSN